MKALFRFGLYEANPATRELLRDGAKIRLQEQPFRLLLLLLENQSEVVTRERLRQELWSEDTFVEFENSLRVAIGKIREALKDDAENPRFVATVPRIGYRFLAPVTVVEPAQIENRAPDRDRDVEESQVSKLKPPSGEKRLLVYACALLLVVGAVFAGFHFWPVAPILANSDTIVLADFDNKTQDPVFDDTLKQALGVQLAQSPFLNLLSDQKINATLRLMGHDPGDRLTVELALDLCQRAGSKAYIAGSIASLGTQYVLGLKAVNCHSGDTLAQVQATANGKEKVLDALGVAASNLRGGLGESLATV
ncbi:MAG: winged helix-turn-helix domain-containing protein, partial [Acidobacteriaceae bacterium]|nr:winged helix-turn-helix domain-containing protein [Acidobacteriaceae bacterium]